MIIGLVRIIINYFNTVRRIRKYLYYKGYTFCMSIYLDLGLDHFEVVNFHEHFETEPYLIY